MNSKLRKLAVIPMIAAAFALTACSGGGRPTSDELVSSLESELTGQFDEATMEMIDLQCIADGLLASDLSDSQLRAIADNTEVNADEASQITEVTTEVTMDCVDLGSIGG